VSDLLVREVSLAQTRPLRQAVLRPHDTLAELAASEADGAFALGAFEQDALIAVGLIAPDGQPGGWRVRGMATARQARGRGAGGAILAGLMRHARAHGARRVWCNARSPARAFYERAGLRVVSEEFEIEDIGPHFVMALELAR
jgi:predicted GNAT family N-acyltransferase